jgi:undecaprenyl-diphosphatase
MITSFSALVLGIIEGFTEFLPISSTAHLILAVDLLNIDHSDFTKTFEIVIQSGAILAVLVLYFRKFMDLEVLKRVVVAFIPTGILGLIFYKSVKTYLIGNIPVVLWALGVGGMLLIIFEYLFKEKDTVSDVKNISYGKAAGIGLFQSIAMIPGTSRAAATIVGGMFMGLRREVVVEFSFLLAVPTMLAATVLDLFKNSNAFSYSEFGVLTVGFITSFIMAIVGIKFLLGYIRKHSFMRFGIYRIILVGLFILFLL